MVGSVASHRGRVLVAGRDRDVTAPCGAVSTTSEVVRSSCGPTTMPEPRLSAIPAVAVIATIAGATRVGDRGRVGRQRDRGGVGRGSALGVEGAHGGEDEHGREGPDRAGGHRQGDFAPPAAAPGGGPHRRRRRCRTGRSELGGVDPGAVEGMRRGPTGVVVVIGPGHFGECTDGIPARARGQGMGTEGVRVRGQLHLR